MRGRRLLMLGLLAAGGAPLACTSILGDFSVGATPSTNDGGAGDGSGLSDGSADANDGAPPFKPLTCKESKVDPRLLIANVTSSNGNKPDRINVFTHATASDSAATVLVPAGQALDGGFYQDVIHAYTFRLQQGSPTVTDHPLVGYRLFDAERYASGVAALVLDSANGQLLVFKLDDATGLWDAGHPASTINEIPSYTCRVAASFKLLSASGDEYFVVTHWVTGSASCTTLNAPVLGASHQKDGVTAVAMHMWGTIPGPDGGTPAGFDLAPQAIVRDGANMTVVVNVGYAGGGGGPTPGVGPILYHSDSQGVMSSAELMKLKAPESILYPMASINSPLPGKGDFAFLGGSLSALGLFVGQASIGQLPTLVPETDLRPTTVAKVGDLPIDKGAMHWVVVPAPNASENFLAASRGASGGANFYWFNQYGQPIAQHAGATGLFQNETVVGLDMGFIESPIQSYGQLEFVLVEATAGGGSNDFSIWGTRVNCD